MNFIERICRPPAENFKNLEDPTVPRKDYRPPLRDDEPAPGGGRKRRGQDLSFTEEDE